MNAFCATRVSICKVSLRGGYWRPAGSARRLYGWYMCDASIVGDCSHGIEYVAPHASCERRSIVVQTARTQTEKHVSHFDYIGWQRVRGIRRHSWDSLKTRGRGMRTWALRGPRDTPSMNHSGGIDDMPMVRETVSAVETYRLVPGYTGGKPYEWDRPVIWQTGIPPGRLHATQLSPIASSRARPASTSKRLDSCCCVSHETHG